MYACKVRGGCPVPKVPCKNRYLWGYLRKVMDPPTVEGSNCETNYL